VARVVSSLTEGQRQHLYEFFQRHPHPPWMHDGRYFTDWDLDVPREDPGPGAEHSD
jgi:hypothetical protein